MSGEGVDDDCVWEIEMMQTKPCGRDTRRPKRGCSGAFAAVFAVSVVMLASAPEARAGSSKTCDRVESDFFEIDGMLDDWGQFKRTRVGGTSADASFDLRCAYDGKMLYVSVNVRDDNVLRTKKARARSEDHVTVSLSVGVRGRQMRLTLFPGADKVRPVRKLGSRKLPRWVSVEDTRQRRGYSVELGVPLAKLSGFGRGTPAINARVEVTDADKYGAKAERTLRFRGELALQGGVEMMRKFLSTTGLSKGAIRLNVLVNADDERGAERVVVGGTIVGVIGDGFNFFRLPISSSSDLIAAKVVDLEGRGRSSIVVTYRERGAKGSRDVVGIWRFAGAGFNRVFSFEIRKQRGNRVLTNTWSVVANSSHKTSRRKRGKSIVIHASEAVGWDEDNWAEEAATDVKSILLPWEDQTSAVYWFADGSAQGGAPAQSRAGRRSSR